MRRIKIVFIHWALYIGGTQTQFLEMARRLNRERFELRVVTFRGGGKVLEEVVALGIPVTVLNFPKSRGLFHPGVYWALWKLMSDLVRYLNQEKPDIVQTFLPWINVCGSIAARIARVPAIVTGRRANIDECYMKMPKFPDQCLQDICNVWTSVVITNSESVKRECLERERFLSLQKIQVIYNGIDPEPYNVKINVAEKRKSLGIPKDCQVVGIIASLHPRKGHQDFLHAAQYVLKSNPNTIFLVVGQDVGIRQQLEELANELNIRGAVYFMGERYDIPELLKILDIQVSTSYVEGLSNALIEGMAAGIPIVATHIAGNPELVVHEKTGVLVPPGEPQVLAKEILHLLSDPSLRAQYGQAGRKRMEALFRIDHLISQSETLYSRLSNA